MLEIGVFWLGVVFVSAGLLMLFWDSFQQKKIWAIISLILIVPLLIHLVVNWSTLAARKSLYALIIGILAILVGISGGALSQLPMLAEHEVVQVLEENIAPPKEVPLSNQEQANTTTLSTEEDYDPLLTGSEYESLEVKEIVPESKQAISNRSPAARYQPVTHEELIHAVNKQIRISMNDGTSVEGKLTNVLDDGVLVESTVDGGSLGLSYKNEQIKSIEVHLIDGEQLYVPSEEPQEEIVEDAEAMLDDAAPEEQVVPPVIEEVIPDAGSSVEEQVIEQMQPAPQTGSNESQNKQHESALEAVQEIIDEPLSLDTPVDQ